jgi:hypothetical protein
MPGTSIAGEQRMIRSALQVAILLFVSTPASATGVRRDARGPSVAAISAPVAPSPPREFGLGALQLVAGYAAEIGGVTGAFAVGLSPKGFGAHSDLATLAFVGALAPALAGGAVCGTGLFSRSYRGRCTTTLLGAYLGAAVGALIGIGLAPKPGPDDTAEFTASLSGGIGLLVLAPIGAVIGYHLGKDEIAPPAPNRSVTEAAPAPITAAVGERSRNLAFPGPQPRLMLPIVSLRW